MTAPPNCDLDVPGWVVIAGEWRWTGAGSPPLRVVHEDYCNYPDCTCAKVIPCSCGRPFLEDGGADGVCECCSGCGGTS